MARAKLSYVFFERAARKGGGGEGKKARQQLRPIQPHLRIATYDELAVSVIEPVAGWIYPARAYFSGSK